MNDIILFRDWRTSEPVDAYALVDKRTNTVVGNNSNHTGLYDSVRAANLGRAACTKPRCYGAKQMTIEEAHENVQIVKVRLIPIEVIDK